uniref:AAA family ATPase n=1 Tax=uncultured Rothia sp. TaxID=316088 RepID=UPI0025D6C356|nr:AAA family ATPase [uncultured Rothia sp.]
MVDATKVSKIKIDTGYAGVKEYPVFSRPDGKTAQCAIILGKNGSGKSTLARALSVDTKSTKFFDLDKNYLGSDCSNVHVFNEAYVIKNFRISKNSSLEPVILLGDHSERMGKIDKLREEIESCKKEISSLKKNILDRVFCGNLSVQNDAVCDFTVGDYVNSCIENELENYKNFNRFNPDDPEGYMNVFEGNRYDYNSYLRWVAQEYFSVWNAVEEERGEIDEIHEIHEIEEIEEYVEYLKGIESEMISCNQELNRLLDAIYSASGNYEAIGNMELLQNKRWETARLISCFIYSKYPDLHNESQHGITTEKECQEFQSLYQKKLSLEIRYKNEHEGLIIDQKKESIDSVIQYMNQWLSLVFGKNSIYLEADQDFGYKVMRDDGEIPPSRLSVGEQNILSLCYFFVNLCGGGKFDRLFAKNQIVILDDPVSSFDDSNKYGVTSLLGYLCQSVLDKASKTKLIIMTHDLSFAPNMSKMIKAIDDSKLSCWELQKDSSDVLIKSKFEDIDRYADMLRIMYDFAVSSQKNAVVPAPNDVRRVWEAFLSFELGETSIAEMGAMKKLSESFSKDKQIERFIKIFIPQLFINSDSHSKSQIMNGNMYLTPTLVGKPYEDFVKNIVCCMHIIAPRHIAWRMKKYKGEGKSILKFVKELDNLLKDVLDSPKIVTAMDSLGEIERLHRMRHRGGRVPLNIRRQAAKR